MFVIFCNNWHFLHPRKTSFIFRWNLTNIQPSENSYCKRSLYYRLAFVLLLKHGSSQDCNDQLSMETKVVLTRCKHYFGPIYFQRNISLINIVLVLYTCPFYGIICYLKTCFLLVISNYFSLQVLYPLYTTVSMWPMVQFYLFLKRKVYPNCFLRNIFKTIELQTRHTCLPRLHDVINTIIRTRWPIIWYFTTFPEWLFFSLSYISHWNFIQLSVVLLRKVDVQCTKIRSKWPTFLILTQIHENPCHDSYLSVRHLDSIHGILLKLGEKACHVENVGYTNLHMERIVRTS